MNEQADVLLLCGDLTDYGLPEEAQHPREGADRRRAHSRSSPCSAITTTSRASRREVCRILTEAGVKVLDGEAVEIAGIGFAGVKGFPGGFGRGTLGAWGEPGVKRVRAGSDRRGDEAGIGARAPAHAAAGGGAALLADPRHGRRRAAGDLSRISARAASKSRSTAIR